MKEKRVLTERGIPRPEHPNPQFERAEWQNLNGEWEFEFDFGNSGLDREFQKREQLEQKIVVPFSPESELSGIGYKDFIPAVWYRKNIAVTQEQLKGRIILHFGAVDYHSIVFVNGKKVISHKGGYTSFEAEITEFCQEGENYITVYAEDHNRDGKQPRGKQSDKYHSWGCDYTRTTGIWQTVWLEYVPENYIKKVKYYPNVTDGTVLVTGSVEGKDTVRAEAFWKGKACGNISARAEHGTFYMTLRLDEIHLWEPGVGNLYDLSLEFQTDKVKSYVGLREVSVNGRKMLLNGQSLFQRLVLDQGYYPDGIYTAPTEEALVRDIECGMKVGFNGARLHQKVFEQRFLYYCDKMGYLVWEEMANWCMDLSDWECTGIYLKEWAEVLERDFNHPSIIGWSPFNETWDYDGRKQRDEIVELVYRITKQLDETRPCIDASGHYHVKTDIFDVHNYEQDVEIFKGHYEEFKKNGETFWDKFADRQPYQKGLPVFVSEYGGIKWSIKEDAEKGWGYGDAPQSENEFIERYRGLTEVLLDNPNICGFCYTQLYDVEQEVNGLYRYSREPKFDMELIKKINQKKAAIEN